MSLKRFSSSTLLLAGLLSGSALAAVPVVESLPASASAATPGSVAADVPEVENQAGPPAVNSTDAAGTTAASNRGGNSTAYFLNQIEALQQRNMVLEGRVEELEFQLKQNEAEFRDRYLDLDERLTRLMDGESQPSVELSDTPDARISSPMELGTVPGKPVAEEDALEQGEREAYQAAFALIREREFDQALDALRGMLKDYPRGQYAANVQYWLGEVLMAQGQHESARKEFQLVMDQYPESNKIPDAAYKLGRLYDLLGDQTAARKHLEGVISQFPDSSAARLSDTYLQTMTDS